MTSTEKGQLFEPLDVEKTLASLTVGEKILLLGGKDFWHFEHVLEKGIPAVRVSDGPNGVRGLQFFNGTPAACFPCGVGLASTWDVELLGRVGTSLGHECRAKGAHMLLGPTMNIQRSPLGGRSFESYAEDPHLTGMIAAAYVSGVQSTGVSACPKHYVANEVEHERFSSDSILSARTLNEVYLEPFRLAVKHSKPLAFMTSYNLVNGLHASENKYLIDDVLRKAWGFDGVVISDWTGVYSTAESIKAGLDVEMPGPPQMRGSAINRQMGAGKLTVRDLDERVRKVLEFVNVAVASKIPFYIKEGLIDTPEVRKLLRECAQSSVVLLKNDAGLLPLRAGKTPLKRIAVFGSNAKVAVPSGGGSAALLSTYTVSPLAAIQEAAKEIGAEVTYSVGASCFSINPLIDQYMVNPTTGTQGAQIDFWTGEPASSADFLTTFAVDLEKPVYSVATRSSMAFMIDGLPFDVLGKEPRCIYRTKFTPDLGGEWTFDLASVGYASLWLDGRLVVDNGPGTYSLGVLFFATGSLPVEGSAELEAGKTYDLEVRLRLDQSLLKGGPFIGNPGIRVGAFPKIKEAEAIKDAASLASKADVAIVVVGTNAEIESESFDREDISLPGASDALVRGILAANPNTVVVTQSGSAVGMPWVSSASSLVHSFFGGNEVGRGIADVIFGKANPSAKLPLTFPVRTEDTPSFSNFGKNGQDGPRKAVYGEGVFVGYKHYEQLSLAPLFPFGHGLSYTTFELSSPSVSEVTKTGSFTATVSVANTGSVDGAEVVQAYITPPKGGRRPRSPPKELAAFAKVAVKARGTSKAELVFDREAFSYWDETIQSWRAEKGVYKLTLATSSADPKALQVDVELQQEIVWHGL